MKKTLFILFALAILFPGCTTKPKEFVYMGQMYNAYGFNSQEKLYGKIKEVIQTNSWAEEVNGRITRGKPYSMADRKAVAMYRDFKEEYNESGAVLRSISYNDSGKVYLDIKSVANGKMLERSDYYMNDSIWGIAKYIYNGDRLVEIDGYAVKNDTVMVKIKSEYDQKGYIIKVEYFNKKGNLTSYMTCERNPDGQAAKIQGFTKEDKLNSLVVNTYNEKGERIKGHEEYLSTGRIVDRTYKYEYDKMGNWTSMIMYMDNKPWVIRAREIRYY
jgi:hypothetical protein